MAYRPNLIAVVEETHISSHKEGLVKLLEKEMPRAAKL